METTYENPAPNRRRRGVFVYTVTFFLLFLIVALNFLPVNDKLASASIDGAFALLMTIVISYLGTHAIDRFSTGKMESMRKKLGQGRTYG